jgi:membrane protein YdbS with pleckstrin-like domain
LKQSDNINRIQSREVSEEMRREPMYRIPKKGLTVWRLYGLMSTGIFVLIGGVISFLTYKFDWPVFIYFIALGVVLVVALTSVWLFPKIRWRHWRYEVREHEIEIQSGLFVVTRTLIPMVRVQHVDTAQGPILKKYDLSNISISTAATTHVIPMLVTEEADSLRARISELARVAEDDV